MRTEIKVQTIESLADLASHTRSHFIGYIPNVLPYIEQAANASLNVVSPKENLDLFEHLSQLREAILDFYIGLIQGLNDCGQADIILDNAPNILQFSLIAAQDEFLPA